VIFRRRVGDHGKGNASAKAHEIGHLPLVVKLVNAGGEFRQVVQRAA